MNYVLRYFYHGTWNYKYAQSDKVLHSQNDSMAFAKDQLKAMDLEDVFDRGEWSIELTERSVPEKNKEALDGFFGKLKI